MTNIYFAENSRHLNVTIGTRGADDALTYDIQPVNIKQGRRLLDLTIGIVLGVATDEEVIEAYKTALGEDNFTRALGADGDGDGELRDGEYELLANGALFWQAHGGSLELAEKLQAGEPLPKVAMAYLLRAGVTAEKIAALKASIESSIAAQDQTEPSGTTSPTGSERN